MNITFLEKVNQIVGMYWKLSMKSYIMTQSEKDALMNGIGKEYGIQIADAFKAGREMHRGKYKYKTLKEYLDDKKI